MMKNFPLRFDFFKNIFRTKFIFHLYLFFFDVKLFNLIWILFSILKNLMTFKIKLKTKNNNIKYIVVFKNELKI